MQGCVLLANAWCIFSSFLSGSSALLGWSSSTTVYTLWAHFCWTGHELHDTWTSMDIWSSIQRSQHATIQCHAVRVWCNMWQPLQCGEDCELCEAHRFRSRRGKASCQLRNSQLLVPFVASEVKVETVQSKMDWIHANPWRCALVVSCHSILENFSSRIMYINVLSKSIQIFNTQLFILQNSLSCHAAIASHCGWAMPTPSAWCSPLPVRLIKIFLTANKETIKSHSPKQSWSKLDDNLMRLQTFPGTILHMALIRSI